MTSQNLNRMYISRRSTPTFKCELLCQRLHVWVDIPRAGNRLNEWWDLSEEHTAHSCFKILMVVSLAVLYTYQHLERTSLLRFGGGKKRFLGGGVWIVVIVVIIYLLHYFFICQLICTPPKTTTTTQQQQNNNNKTTTTKQQQKHTNKTTTTTTPQSLWVKNRLGKTQ